MPESEISTKIITMPCVRLVGRQEVDPYAMEFFLAQHNVSHWETDTNVGAEELVEVAGRLCYMSFAKPRPGGNAVYLEHIIDVGHGSVLEHAVFNFIITGVSRSFSHEMVRHRAGWGYSQLSQRFVDESDCEFVVPPLIKQYTEDTNDPRLADTWKDIVGFVQGGYGYIAKTLEEYLKAKGFDGTDRRKMAREAARSVLPNATETKMFVTANCRAIRHFVEMRGNAAADAEIRSVAVAVLRVMQKEAPNIFGDYRILPCPKGGEMVETDHPKV